MDSYSVLGINRNASRADVDAAYRSLMEKYSEEKYQSGPLADLAQKKREEIKLAYDAVIKELAAKDKAAAENAKTYSGSTDPEFEKVRSYINAGNFAEAERLLLETKNHNAEWYYLMGCVDLRRGNYNGAYANFKTATNKDPMNMEYKNAFLSMQNSAGAYRNMPMGDMSQPDMCNCCSNLICADCLCECMGGDLVPCC